MTHKIIANESLDNLLVKQFEISFNFFNKVACGLWIMKIPDIINVVADKKRDETDEPGNLVVRSGKEPDEESVEEPAEESVEELQLGMQFYADMLNRLFFCIIIAVIFIAFGCTFVRAWAQYFYP